MAVRAHATGCTWRYTQFVVHCSLTFACVRRRLANGCRASLFTRLLYVFVAVPLAAPRFAWSDGIFLKALRAGDWVLLDELNLASQSVLEGLNACLDHRGTVYIPEIDRCGSCCTA